MSRRSSKDLTSKYGLSLIMVSLNVSKLDRLLKQHGLPSVATSRFETTRTAPQTGTYFSWLLLYK